MGLKREHKENLTRLTRGQEVKLFTLRGEHAHALHEYEERIVELEETVRRLTQELERLKTISDIEVIFSRNFGDPSCDLDSTASTLRLLVENLTLLPGCPGFFLKRFPLI